MQKITLLAVGKLKEPWARDAAEYYCDRLQHALKFEVIELPASKEKHPDRQRSDESKRLIDAAKKLDGVVWILDEQGKAMTSPMFAKEVEQSKNVGSPMMFLLGGAYGLTDDVRATASKMLRLSDMVLPHELCRVVFLEQLYRATEMMRGSGYHHGKE